MIPHPVTTLRNRAHRWVWTVLVSLLAGAGGAIAILDQGLATTLGFGLGCAAVFIAIDVNVTRAAMRLKPVVALGLIGALAGMCALGWYALLGWATAWLGAVIVASSPAIHSQCHTWLAGRVPIARSQVAPAGSDSRRVVHALSDRELCLAWQISTLALTELQHRGDIANQAAMIGLRQAYLDEFSIRRRAGFEQWLSAGAWPSGDPEGPNAVS